MLSTARFLLGFSVVSCLVSCNLSLYHDGIPCNPVGKCKCEFPNGLGVDLSLLRGFNFSIPIKPGSTILFFPCKNIQVESIINVTKVNECSTGVSLCLQENDSFHSLGTMEDSSFLWERIEEEPELTFVNHNNNESTNILLKCDTDSKDPVVEHKSSTPNHHTLELITKLACLTTVEEEGRSVFSTVFIVLLFLFFVYLFGGFLVLRFIRGARGWEAIPNGEFWNSVITATKRMFAFIMNGCQHPETYDSI